ncbi:MAG: right-handed parallel beta-helix repeat-containing protein, partial [Candidatus Eisenbacteria bacterium]
MRLAAVLFVAGLVVLVTSTASARTWYILPDGTGDAPTIQAGIDSAAAWDTVLVACGTYYEHDITLASGRHVIGERTDTSCVVIDAQGQGRVLYSGAYIAPGTRIEGLTITGGVSAQSPNTSLYGGGGYLYNFQGVISDCRVHGNEATYGGGLSLRYGAPTVVNCLVYENSASGGGGFDLANGNPVLQGCTIAKNQALSGSGISDNSSFSLTIENTIVAFNLGGEAFFHAPSASLSCCDIFGNEGGNWTGNIASQLGQNGNIEEDPLFCHLEENLFTLGDDSPCAPAANPACGLIGALGVGCSSFQVYSVTDVPNDQGRQVRVRWLREYRDRPGMDTTITHYTLWRRIDDGAKRRVDEGARTRLGFPPGEWDYVLTAPAYAERSYSAVCPTLCDSTIAAGQCWSVFFVRAGTDAPSIYFDTPPDSGYSLDNLSPGVPGNLRIESPALLAWDESQDEDFDYFSVCRSDDPEFTEAELVGHTIESNMDVGAAGHGYYRVTATDFSGNESEPSAVLWVCTGVADPPPSRYSLGQNVPNP